LLFKPGFLTKEYWDGRRSRYISPIRIYLVISFIVFAILPLSLTIVSDGNGLLFEATENTQLPDGYEGIGVFIPLIKTFEENGDLEIARILKEGIEETQRRKMTAEQIFFSAIPTSMFILMPIFAVFLYLILFRNKELSYVHHLITVFHLHSTAFIFILIFLIFSKLGLLDIFGNVLLFYFWPIFSISYFCYFLKIIYNNSWIITVIKTLVLGSIYLVTFFFSILYIMFFAMVLFGQPNI
ncbi:uncharacterized protein METZ01_LOCUS467135, partial [marine metagenome]